ncbi:hypothetical protein [Paracoccus sp. ME4]|uniref:hypothetical protein n=1 Tax=Paracoccus sp. ME4 TaxID=3138066 RepID=UPI00398A6CAF
MSPDMVAALEKMTAAKERGPWMVTASGLPWYLLDPRPEDVRIVDIAAGLSRVCRYNGQLLEEFEFLSVAEHSTLMTRWALDNGVVTTREDALAILLHDGPEALLGDKITPMKAIMPEFRWIEDRTQDVLMSGFGLASEDIRISKEMIKLIDRRIRIDERDLAIEEPARTVGAHLSWLEEPGLAALDVPLEGKLPKAARRDFLECFVECVRDLEPRNPEADPIHQRQLRAAVAHLERMNSPHTRSKPDMKDDSMTFPVSDPFDNTDQQTLRHVAHQSLKRIGVNRSQFMTTCPNRPHLAGLTEEGKRLAFGAQMLAAVQMSRGGLLPDRDADTFISKLSGQPETQTQKKGFLSRMLGTVEREPDPELKHKLEPALSTWPDFDLDAWQSGRPQSEEFMEEFRIDFPSIREIAFEYGKTRQLAASLETHISKIAPIVQAFDKAAFAGIDADKLESFVFERLDEAKASVRHANEAEAPTAP